MFAKSEVNGENTNIVFNYLRRNSRLHNESSGNSRVVPWNFTKFIMSPGKPGNQIGYYNPRVELRNLQRVIDDLMEDK